ncbi:MAG: phage portal protein [Gammaproteobacteria bacterium]|nr:phage portal protein [Gammaproteobacteria bacterium]
MKWLDRFREKRTRSNDPYLAEFLGLRDNAAGQFVSEDTATGIPAVHACVQLIAESVASLPLAPYRRQRDGSKLVDTSHPIYDVLHHQANEVQTAFEFREQFVASCLLTGNAYAVKVVDGRGNIVELRPVPPGQMAVEKLPNGRLRYKVSSESGTRVHVQDEILHLRYRSKDGYLGLSPITIARETIGLAQAQQTHESAFFRNGARFIGAFKMPTGSSFKDQDALNRFRDSIRDAHASPGNHWKFLVLENGLDFTALNMSHADAQFVESRKLTLEDVARIYRVPPPAIGILDKATYSNITEQSRHLVIHCLRPWLVRIEQAMNAALLSEDGRRTHAIEHNAEGLLRGDTKARYEAYRIGREWGWLSANDVRSLENMSSIEGGNTYSKPMNSEPLGRSAA